MEYLLSQTGKPLVQLRSQDALLVDDDRMTSLTEEDEGFDESDEFSISEQIEDLSLHVILQVKPSTEQPRRSVTSSKLFPSVIQAVMSRSDVSSAMATSLDVTEESTSEVLLFEKKPVISKETTSAPILSLDPHITDDEAGFTSEDDDSLSNQVTGALVQTTTPDVRAVPLSTHTQAVIPYTQTQMTSQDVGSAPPSTHTQAVIPHTQVILLTPSLVEAMIV